MQSNKNNIKTFSDLYHRNFEENKFLTAFITGHLSIEFLLRKLISIYDINLEKLSNDLSFFKLVNLVYELKMLSNDQKEVLLKINQMRNKFAHDLNYIPNIDDLKDLFIISLKSFNDFTDGISQDLGEINETYEINKLEDWVISELFIQISYDLHHEYQDRGGDIEDF